MLRFCEFYEYADCTDAVQTVVAILGLSYGLKNRWAPERIDFKQKKHAYIARNRAS